MEPITSRDNRQIKELAALLAQKKQRDASGLFALEGARLCADAAGSGVRVRTVFLSAAAGEKYPDAAERLRGADALLWISDELSARISDTKSPQGIFAVCEKPEPAAPRALVRPGGAYLLAVGLQDPGNFGTILRTAQALGADGAFACDCPDLYSPKVLRASMGGVFRLPVAVCAAGDALLALRGAGIPVWAAALDEAAVPPSALDGEHGIAVMVGNEGSGLPKELVRAADGVVCIPMLGGAESLNAASAASILIWEMTRNRR